ncbi:MAG: zinc dependent phospholipase C family protein [Acidobacteriota bacterium]
MKTAALAGFLFIALLLTPSSSGYSVLTHEEIVDLLWTTHIRPLLLERYPGLSEKQLIEAHAYAYGGSVIQDLGYYPFGSKEFSDLTHYVRSGDFVSELILESRNANEYAFALGAMAHYVSDIDGHPAVNQAVAIEHPHLRSRFGRIVTYEDDESAHLKTEFGFDVEQVSRHRYAPQDYRNFVGFDVSMPLLERVFPIVYGVELDQVLKHQSLAVGSYRWAISQLIPHMTKVAIQAQKKELKHHRQPDTAAQQIFLYHVSRADYRHKWGKKYRHAGLGTRLLAALLNLVPKVGPFKGLGFTPPPEKAEELYLKSIDKTYADYDALLTDAKAGTPQLPDRDLDTGARTSLGEYKLADRTYGKLLRQLDKQRFADADGALRKNILGFYASGPKPKGWRARHHWHKIKKELKQMQAAPTAAHPAHAGD